MPGLKNRSVLVALVWLTASAGAPQPQLLGTAVMFAGWRGETPVIREDENFDNGRIKTTLHTLSPDSRMLPLAQPVYHLPQGSILVKDYAPIPDQPAVEFRLNADPKETEALEKSLAAWWQRGDGKAQTFPEVHAIFTILLDGKQLWTKKRTLGVSAGEGGFEYKPPKLRFAVLSPAKSTLVVELTGSDGSEFIRIPVQR